MSGSNLLAFEVDKLSKSLIKPLNVVEYIQSNIQNIKAPRTNELIILVCMRKYTYRIHLRSS